jgi:hypothetical protein
MKRQGTEASVAAYQEDGEAVLNITVRTGLRLNEQLLVHLP